MPFTVVPGQLRFLVAGCAKKVHFHAVDDALEGALKAVEAATGLPLCVKVLDSRFTEGTALGVGTATRRYHSSSFCNETKRHHRPACLQCCLRERPARAAEQGEAFLHRCHAGGEEWLVPVHVGGRLVALVYLGPFRTGAGQPEQLPRLSLARRALLPGVGELLREYLAAQAARPAFPTESTPAYRREAVEGFLRDHLHENPRLGDVARYLGLSPSRTAHAVAEATGCSFTALRDALRLERACRLLETTYAKVAHIATECGCPSPHYFHRFFRQKTGLTPAAWRRAHRREA